MLFMGRKNAIGPVRVLPEDVANKIAAGEVVERPASVVKELVENALDAGATRITVRLIGDGRRLVEVTDNGLGMSEQDAMLAIERHATSKIRKADDLDNVHTLGFRGEALASIAAVSRFELVTRREKDQAATRVQVDGGIMREVTQTGAAVGTRVTVNRLYFNTPVRAKFLKGITTELGHCIDAVQRHALANAGVGFQFIHNDKTLLDVPPHADLRERAALIWGLHYVRDMVEITGEQAGLKVNGLIGTPALSRSARSHQFFFMNGRPIRNRTLQYGFEAGYQSLLTIGRHPVGILLLETHPRFVDVNIHPTKQEIRFRDERVVRDAVRDIVRRRLEALHEQTLPEAAGAEGQVISARYTPGTTQPAPRPVGNQPRPTPPPATPFHREPATAPPESPPPASAPNVQTEFVVAGIEPAAVYRAVEGLAGGEAMQLFETYLLVPEEDRLLIIDQHALHERMNYDALVDELRDSGYEAQQLIVPVVIDVAPAQSKLIESNFEAFSKLGIELEPFGGSTYQVTAICHLYEESRVPDMVYRVLDELQQGDLFDREDFMADLLRLATRACRASVKAGDRLGPEEKRELIDGFRRMRPPYTCPHGRPIITELTLTQMEKSFRRRQ
ncbi:MAG: DNA mismatch repair endonuclease MutL [Candidatus Hydrogenedentota bacterium]